MQKVLRPLSLGDLFDEVFDLYKRNFLLFVVISSILYLPYIWVILTHTSSAANSHSASSANSAGYIWLVAILLSMPMSFVLTGATTQAVSTCYIGRKPTIIAAYKSVFPKLIPLTIASIITCILIFVGCVLCIIPGIYAAVFTSFVPQIIILENMSCINSIKRSYTLTSSHRGRVFVVMFLTLFVGFVLRLVTTAPFLILESLGIVTKSLATQSLQVCVQALVASIVHPISLLAFVVLYYDVRVRKEGFDIHLLAQNMTDSQNNS